MQRVDTIAEQLPAGAVLPVDSTVATHYRNGRALHRGCHDPNLFHRSAGAILPPPAGRRLDADHRRGRFFPPRLIGALVLRWLIAALLAVGLWFSLGLLVFAYAQWLAPRL